MYMKHKTIISWWCRGTINPATTFEQSIGERLLSLAVNSLQGLPTSVRWDRIEFPFDVVRSVYLISPDANNYISTCSISKKKKLKTFPVKSKLRYVGKVAHEVLWPKHVSLSRFLYWDATSPSPDGIPFNRSRNNTMSRPPRTEYLQILKPNNLTNAPLQSKTHDYDITVCVA